jgi:hypothetical protein
MLLLGFYQGPHGGTWRCAYEVDSIGETPNVLVYFTPEWEPRTSQWL